MENQNLFVITGGPGSGKTTVLRELQNRGFRIAPEVARQIIQEQVQQGGNALPWKDQESYTRLMLQRSIQSYQAHTTFLEPTISDRAIPDTLCYARLIRLPDDESIGKACDQYRYAHRVFFAPAWREIYETDSERKQDFAEAVQTSELMADVYRECGYELVELPKLTPAKRAEFILNELRLSRVTRLPADF